MRRWIFRRPETVLIWALVGMLVLIGGCCGPGPQRPLRPWFPPCDPSPCGQSCWEAEPWGAGLGNPARRQTEADLACQGCLPTPPAPAAYYPGPLSWLFARLWWPYGPGFAGCGERYWSPWVADPPDCCDPCDGYGQWTGSPRGTGYSSMYPNLFPGGVSSGIPMETEPAVAPTPAPRARPGCSECGKGHQARSVRPPTPSAANTRQPFIDPRVYPTGYSNLAQRPWQAYRDPITR
jgi:hypothetical protein